VIRRRAPRGRRGGLWLALAGAAGLLAAVLTLRAAAQPSHGGAVLVARSALPPGLLLDESAASTALGLAPVPAGLALRGLVTDPAQVVGRRLAVPLAAGEPVTEAALGGAPGSGPAPLAPGERAVAVPTSVAGAAAGGLRPGARVDVVASSGEGLAGRTRIVVLDAEVLGVAGPSSSDGVDLGGEALLRVSRTEALRLTAALNFAREVRLLVRPADEPETSDGPLAVGAP
jgi:Flp pilus assembly protein CpaB